MCADWLEGGYQSIGVSSPQSLQQASQSRRKLQDHRQSSCCLARKRGYKLTEKHWGGAHTYFNITVSCFCTSSNRQEWDVSVEMKYKCIYQVCSNLTSAVTGNIFTHNWKSVLSNRWIPGAVRLKFFFIVIACLFSRLLWIKWLWLIKSEFLPLCAAVNQGFAAWF